MASTYSEIWIIVILVIFLGLVVPNGARKNVLLIVSDDLRPQLGCYEGRFLPSPVHPTMYTPNIDKLARRSLLLNRAYAQQALCSPSRSSVLTARRPDTTHVYDLRAYFRNVGGNFTTLPQYFKQNGYQTVGMGKIFHPGNSSAGDDPVSWSQPYFHGVHNFESRNNSWEAIQDDLLLTKPLVDQQILTHAKETLKRVSTDTAPFFVAVGFRKPHLPFVFPASFLQHYPDDTVQLPPNPRPPVNMPEAAWSAFKFLRSYFLDIRALNLTGDISTIMPDVTTRQLRKAYYAAISYVDSLVGDLLLELHNLGVDNDTIVLFFGDHGYQLGEHGEWGKSTNFELATHSPLMIHIPGMTDNGIQSDQLVELIDIFPTLVEAAGLPALDPCPPDSTQTALCREGTSLIPLISDPVSPIKMAAFSQYPREVYENGSTSPTSLMGYSIRTDKYRYTEWPEFRTDPVYKPDWGKLHGVELYDHGIDPDENYNLAGNITYRSVCENLSKLLHAGWRKAGRGYDQLSTVDIVG